MNKFYALLASIVLLFTSCSMGEMHMITNDTQIANNSFEEIIDAIQSKNENAFKGLFSKKAITEDENFDESVLALIDFFEGKIISYNDWGGPQSSQGKNDDGTGRNWKRLRSTYDVETSEQKYRFAIEEFTVDTADPDNVGIRSMYIIKAEDSDLEFAYWGDGKWTPGITIEKK